MPQIFSHSATFFARPQSEKEALEWTTPAANRGYARLGREKVSQGLTKEDVDRERQAGEDMKESYDIGREEEPRYPNPWPDDWADGAGAEFKRVMQDFFGRCKELHSIIMRAIALGFGFPATFFDQYVRRGDNTLRLLHYPAVSQDARNGEACVRAGLHSDFGSITLLFQDGTGGLQVEQQNEPGAFIDVPPRKGTIVLNSGDLLTRWSNGLIRSTKHRVIEPPGHRVSNSSGVAVYPERYSVAYFCNPDFDRWIEALPGTWEGEKGGKKFEGVNSGDYLVQRLSAIY